MHTKSIAADSREDLIRLLNRCDDSHLFVCTFDGEELEISDDENRKKTTSVHYLVREVIEGKANLEGATDKYISINGFHHYMLKRPTPHKKKDVLRRVEYCVKTLNAHFIDIDIKNTGKTKEELLSLALELERLGVIPKISIIIHSGRGFWLLWLLGNEESPILAVKESILDWKYTQKFIIKKIGELGVLGADLIARDATRCCRPNGTINSKSNKRVVWELHNRSFYNQGNFTKLFGIEEDIIEYKKIIESRDDDAKKRKPCPERSKGPKILAVRRGKDMMTVQKIAKTQKGFRRRFLSLYAMMQRISGVPKSQIEAEVLLMANRCEPPFFTAPEDRDIKRLMSTIYSCSHGVNLRFSHEHFIKFLSDSHNLSVEEIGSLGLEILKPKIAVRRSRSKRKPSTKAKDRASKRRMKIKELVESGTTTQKGLLTELKRRQIKISKTTLKNDLVKIGIKLRDY